MSRKIPARQQAIACHDYIAAAGHLIGVPIDGPEMAAKILENTVSVIEDLQSRGLWPLPTNLRQVLAEAPEPAVQSSQYSTLQMASDSPPAAQPGRKRGFYFMDEDDDSDDGQDTNRELLTLSYAKEMDEPDEDAVDEDGEDDDSLVTRKRPKPFKKDFPSQNAYLQHTLRYAEKNPDDPEAQRWAAAARGKMAKKRSKNKKRMRRDKGSR